MTLLLIVFSWFIVAFGHPGWWPWLGSIAACLGYALFWKESLKISSRKRRFWLACGWFYSVQAIQLFWMTATEFHGWYILGVWMALCLWLGAQFGLLTLTINKIPHIAVAALWTLFEWSRLYLLCGFSWNPSGLVLTFYSYPMQFVSLFGIFGLSFWVILTNLAFLKEYWKTWLALTIFPYLFGVLHLAYHEKKLEKSSHLSVGLVQTALLPSQKSLMKGRKDEFVSPYDQWKKIFNSLRKSNQKFDLIVLPEYAVPFAAETPIYATDKTLHILETTLGKEAVKLLPPIENQVKVSNCFWGQALANVFSAEVVAGLDAREEGKHYSAAFHFLPHTSRTHRYEKQILLPLAEYIPFGWLKKFTEKYGIFEFFTPGKESKVFPGVVPFSVSICYEETFSHLIREGRVKGAELLVNVTNDGWYPYSNLAQEHFMHARVRSVENGAPLVRACNTAVTAAVDSLGRTIGQITEEQRAAVLAVSLPSYHYFTLYTFWGNWGIVTLCFIFLLISWYNSRKSYF